MAINPNLTTGRPSIQGQQPARMPAPVAKEPTAKPAAPGTAAPAALQARAPTVAQLNMGLTELPPEVRAAIDKLPPAFQGKLAEVASGLSRNNLELTGHVRATWSSLLNESPVRTPTDINSLVQWVLREAYIENTKDLHFFAEKVRFYNDIKKQLRNELTRARELLAKMAGQDGEALLPDPFIPADIDETYTGVSTQADANAATTAQTSQAQTQAEQQPTTQQAYQQAYAAWQAMPTVPEQVSFGHIGEKGNNHSHMIKDADVFDTMMDGGGRAWIDNVVAWFSSLPQDQQAALVEKWKTEGMKFYALANETQGKDQSAEYSNVRTLPAGKSVTQWLRDECERAIKHAANDLTKQDFGKKLKLEAFEFRIEPPTIGVQRPPAKPAELVALEQELGLAPPPADETSAETVSYASIEEDGNNYSHKIKDADVYDTIMSGGGQSWVDNVVAWFNSLPREQQDALVEKWKTEGMRFFAHAHETQGIVNHSATYDEVRTLPAGRNPADWLRQECERAIQQTALDITRKDPGKKLKLADFNFRVEPPSVQVVPAAAAASSAYTGASGVNGSTSAASFSASSPPTTKEELETYIKNTEERLNSVGDDAQLANVDLQNMLQKQQQTLQMMSNISKMLHDTAMAIIRKMGS